MDANKLAALHLLQLLGAGLPANVTTISGNSVNISQTASQTTPKPTMITSAVAPTITVTAEPPPKPSVKIVPPHSTSTCHTNPFTCTTVSSATVSTGTMSSSSLATPTHFSSSSATTVYSYKVKILNPKRKREAIVGLLHGCNSKFKSLTLLKAYLMDEFREKVPSDLTFAVGYFENSTKCWLLKDEDLSLMYDRLSPKREIMLWCDGRYDSSSCHEEGPTSKKSKKAEEREKSEDKGGGTSEKDFDAVVKQLQKKHGDIYSVPLLRLWARVHVNGLHDSLDDHPDLPQFKVAKGPSHKQSDPVLSPNQVAETRSTYIQQLQQIKLLCNEGILSSIEYDEQKDIILSSLRKLK